MRQGTVSKALFDTTTAARDSARAKVEAIRAQLADRVITAPFAGVLGLRQVSPGDLSHAGTPITTLDDIHVIKLDFAVPEAQLALLQPGLPLRARARGPTGAEFTGEVASIDRAGSRPRARALTIARPPPTPIMPLTGMLAAARTAGQYARRPLTVPELALVPPVRASSSIASAPDATVKQVEVRLGAPRRRSGSAGRTGAGDRIVVEGTVSLARRRARGAGPAATPGTQTAK